MARPPDNPARRGPADRTRIDLRDEYDVRYWTTAFGVTAEQLKAAVKAVGPMAADVKSHFDKS
jgi:hypothetical protein